MLMQVREISERVAKEGGLTVLVNPQFTSGNLVSDFGIGPWRRRSEEFVASFEQTYMLKQMRISGDNIRRGAAACLSLWCLQCLSLQV